MRSVNHLAYLSLGSNIDRENNIRSCLDALAAEFGSLSLSSVYESEAVGFCGDPFLNLVVGLKTTLALSAFSEKLHQIEDSRGRERSGPKFSGRTLDIDILLFDALCGEFHGIHLPRPEIKQNAYVLLPLAEIAGPSVLPGDTVPVSQLWRDYKKDSQRLWPVDFSWADITLPHRIDL